MILDAVPDNWAGMKTFVESFGEPLSRQEISALRRLFISAPNLPSDPDLERLVVLSKAIFAVYAGSYDQTSAAKKSFARASGEIFEIINRLPGLDAFVMAIAFWEFATGILIRAMIAEVAATRLQ